MLENYVKEIHDKGFVKIAGLFESATAEQLKASLLQYDVTRSEINHFIYNLQNKDINFFTLIMRHPLLRSLLLACLNDEWYKKIPLDKANFILHGLVGRTGGEKGLHLHTDSYIPHAGPYIWNMVVTIALDSSNADNGCTLFVPGSHRFGCYGTQDWLKYAVPMECEPGDVIVWDTRLWHAAGANTGPKTRWVIHGTFSRWWLKSVWDIPRAIPRHFLVGLSDEEKSVLGFCSMSPLNETEGLILQGGYEKLAGL